MTQIVEHFEIPDGAVWCIGQHSKAERAALERRVRAGEMAKVRAHWHGVGPLKMVFVPL